MVTVGRGDSRNRPDYLETACTGGGSNEVRAQQATTSLYIRSVYAHLSAIHIARQSYLGAAVGPESNLGLYEVKDVRVCLETRYTCPSTSRLFFVPYVPPPDPNLNPGSNPPHPCKVGYMHPANPIPNPNARPLLGNSKQNSQTGPLQRRPDKHKDIGTRWSVTAERRA
jgi:hypothetical protein